MLDYDDLTHIFLKIQKPIFFKKIPKFIPLIPKVTQIGNF